MQCESPKAKNQVTLCLCLHIGFSVISYETRLTRNIHILKEQLADRKIRNVDGTQWRRANAHMFVKLAEHHLLRSLSGLCEVNVVGIHGRKRQGHKSSASV